MQRPDLSNLSPTVVRYIIFLEKKLGIAQNNEDAPNASPVQAVESSYYEPETSDCILTLSQQGLVKRTYRHLYPRQHRGGMGIFDLDAPTPDQPSILANAYENQTLLVFTNHARVFRIQLNTLDPAPVRSRGTLAFERYAFESGERVTTILPEQARGYVALASEHGKVRSLRHHLFGEHMRQGTQVFNTNDFGPLACACWTPGDADLMLVTQLGAGIRFSEKAVPPQGGLGLRVGENDKVISITSVEDNCGVFLLGSDGKGTIRLMSGFAANKSPGGSGKIAFKSNQVIGACTILPDDDIFIISRLGKVIRFKSDEVPPTEGVVQGVNCISMRADEAVSVLRCGMRPL
jgi:DNA gyrase subunit A